MNDNLNKLKSIGAQKIHEKTHIAKQFIEAILEENYSGMTKIHFVGFVSIIEREYNIELDDLKTDANTFYTQEPQEPVPEKKVFVTPAKSKSYTATYISIAVIIFIIAIFFTINQSSKSSNAVQNSMVDNSTIEMAQEKIEHNNSKFQNEEIAAQETIKIIDTTVVDSIEIQEVLITEDNSTLQEIVDEEEAVEVTSFIIKPKTNLWIGYKDLSTGKKYQKTFKTELSLDPTKDWLLTLGHGYVKMLIDSKEHDYNTKYNVKFLYKNSTLTKITFQEYKKINNGSKW